MAKFSKYNFMIKNKIQAHMITSDMTASPNAVESSTLSERGGHCSVISTQQCQSKESLEDQKVSQSLALLHQSSTMLSRPLSFSLQASSSSWLATICRSNSCSRHAKEAGLAEDQPAASDCSSTSSS